MAVAPQGTIPRTPIGGFPGSAASGGGFFATASAAVPYIAAALAVFSLFSSLTDRAKNKERIKDSRIVELGALGTSGEELGVCLGRSVVDGLPFYGAISENIPAVGRAGSGGVKKVWGTLGVKDDSVREKSLLIQEALSIDELDDILAVSVNDKILGVAPPGSGIDTFKSDVARVEWNEYQTASATATTFTNDPSGDGGNTSGERDENSICYGKTFVTALHFLTTDANEEVVYSGREYPQREYHVRGVKVPTYDENGQFIDKIYQNNTVWVLLYYLNSLLIGPRKDGEIQGDENFDLPAWTKAAGLAARPLKGGGEMADIPTLTDEQMQQNLFMNPRFFPTAVVVAALPGWVGDAPTYTTWDEFKVWVTMRVNEGLVVPTYIFIGGPFGTAAPRLILQQYGQLRNSINKAGFFPSSINLIKHETNGTLPSDETWEESWTRILDAIPGAELYKRIQDDKIVLDIPDGYTDEEDQSVRTFTNDDVINLVQVDRPDSGSGLINQYSVRFRNVQKYGEEDTITFPKEDSAWLHQLVENDGGKFATEATPFGIDNEKHAKAWAATHVLLSHRYVYTWEVPLWQDAKLNVFPGNVVTLTITGKQSIDRHIRLSIVHPFKRNGQWFVRLSGRHFVKTDYQTQLDDDEVIEDLNAFNTSRITPVTSFTASAVSNDVTLRWINDVPGPLDEGYIIQTKSVPINTRQGEIVSALAAQSWGGRVTIDNPEVLEYSYTAPSGIHLYRIAKRDFYQKLSTWVESVTPLEIDVIIPEGGAGLPALTTFDYDTPDQTPDTRGEYAFFAGRNWETLADEATRPGYVTLDHEPSDGENIADYLNSVKIGDTHGLIRSPAEFILKRIIGVPNYRYQLIGTLPAGVTFDPVNRILRGVTDEAGTYPLVLRITDEYGNVTNRNFSLTVNN